MTARSLYAPRGELDPPGAVRLEEQFPRDEQVLRLLRLTDAHFCNLAARYHALNRSILRIEGQRIEGGAECASDMYLSRLKRQRLSLLDEIAAIMEVAEQTFASQLTGAASDISKNTPHDHSAGKFAPA